MPARPTRRRRNKKGNVVATLSLVSLMDMFTIVLIFLLHSFSATGETFATSDKFQLPVSTATAAIRPALTIQVTTKDIMVEGRVVVARSELIKDKVLIEPLLTELEEEAKKSVFIAGINKSMELSRTVIILGDRSIDFSLLERVMYTCGQVGYNNITLAVLSGES
ncbi:MAG: biopolymer transporter ExbD [Deltaproteobacteria bacterium]|nr:biopolymer transporter ExbD [Deltaproteobacteria bacterium]